MIIDRNELYSNLSQEIKEDFLILYNIAFENLNIPKDSRPVIKLAMIEKRNIIASHSREWDNITVDILKCSRGKKLLRNIAHEARHVWQDVYYSEISSFFRENRKLYAETYSTAYNIVETDATVFSSTNGIVDLNFMFEKYDIKFFKTTKNHWRQHLPYMNEEVRRAIGNGQNKGLAIPLFSRHEQEVADKIVLHLQSLVRNNP